MEKKELYRLSHNLWKTKTLVEKAYELTLKTIDDKTNMPFLETVLEELYIGMIANLNNSDSEEK